MQTAHSFYQCSTSGGTDKNTNDKRASIQFRNAIASTFNRCFAAVECLSDCVPSRRVLKRARCNFLSSRFGPRSPYKRERMFTKTRVKGQQSELLVAGRARKSLRGALLPTVAPQWGVGGICLRLFPFVLNLIDCIGMILTREILHSAGTAGCGFNRHQLSLLGIQWPPRKGWLCSLVGKEVSSETWETVLRLRGVKRKFERLDVMRNPNYTPRLF